MKKVFTKIGFGFLAIVFLFVSIFAPVAQAETQKPNWYNQGVVEWYTKVYDEKTSPPNEIFGERYTAAQVQWILWSLITLPLNIITDGNTAGVSCILKRFADNTVDISDCVQLVSGQVINTIENIFPRIQASAPSPTNLVFNSNRYGLSGVGYLKNLVSKFSLVKDANAQGYGYSAIFWIQKYWQGFRDISYTLFVLLIIIFAFMIMFKVKISPQAVITVQYALPKIIGALILATFSYAIAGFMIDLMYVVAGLFSSLLVTANFSSSFQGAFGVISGSGMGFQIGGGFTIFFIMIGYTIIFLLAAIVNLISTVASLSIFGTIVSIIMILMTVWVLILTIWYGVIKMPLMLLKTLVSVYISIITAPLQITAGVIAPSMGFVSWMKKLAADLLVFPVVGLLIWFSWSTLFTSISMVFVSKTPAYAFSAIFDVIAGREDLISTFSNEALFKNPKGIWMPPLIGSAENMTGILFMVISFMCIVAMPKVPDILKSVILGERFAFGTAIEEAMKAGQGAYDKTLGVPMRGYAKLREENFATTFIGDINRRVTDYEARTGRAIHPLLKGFLGIKQP